MSNTEKTPMMTLSQDELKFLKRCAAGNVGTCIDRAEDRARQKCRRKKLAEFDRHVWMWCITREGLAAIEQTKS